MLVPAALLQDALAQIAALTAELAEVRAEAAAQQVEMQAKLDMLMAKLDAALGRKRKMGPRRPRPRGALGSGLYHLSALVQETTTAEEIACEIMEGVATIRGQIVGCLDG